MLVKRDDIQALVNIIHNSGKTVVCTNGCFDILHIGHVRYFEKTKSFADFSIVSHFLIKKAIVFYGHSVAYL